MRWWLAAPIRRTWTKRSDQVFAILEPGWRAITAADIENVILQNHADIARAHCLPGHDLTLSEEHGNQAGHIGVIVVPQPAHQWTAAAADLRHVAGFTPDGRRLAVAARPA